MARDPWAMRTGPPKRPVDVPKPRPKALRPKIFVLGLTHTGKNSVNAALEKFGYNCKHYPHPKRVIEESELYDVLNDTPVLLFMEALDHLYPDARFIYTIRDQDDWLRSCEPHFTNKRNLRELQLWNRRVVYGTETYDEQLFRKAWLRYYNRVKAYFRDRPGKLLIMNVCGGDGYEKLCPFIGEEVIDEPFPHRNRK